MKIRWRKVPGFTCLSALMILILTSGCSQTAQKKTITWMVPEDPLIDKYAFTVADEFQKEHPDVLVKVLTPGSTGYGQKLLTLIVANEAPDIFTDWDNTGVYTLVAHHLVQNLNPYFKEANINPEYIPATYREEYGQSGEIFGIPWNSNPQFLVYNKDLFQKYNVPLPPTNWNDQSWTLDKLLEDAKLLTHDTDNPKIATWGAIINPGTIGSFGWLWGVDPLNNQGGPAQSSAYKGEPVQNTYVTQPKMVEAMTWLADLTNKWHVSPSPGELKALSSAGNPFFSGKVAITQVAGGWLTRQATVAKPNFHWAIAPFPNGPAGVDTNQREDNAFYLSRTSANPKLAFELMLFATRGLGADQLIQIAKDNPPNVDNQYFDKWYSNVSNIPGLSMTKDEFTSVFLGGIKNDFPDPGNIMQNPADFKNSFTQLMSPVWLGEESVSAGLESVQRAWQHTLLAP